MEKQGKWVKTSHKNNKTKRKSHRSWSLLSAGDMKIINNACALPPSGPPSALLGRGVSNCLTASSKIWHGKWPFVSVVSSAPLFDRAVWKCLLNIDFRPIDAFTCPMFVAIKMWLVMNERPHVKGLAKEIEERPSKFELFVMRTISNYCGFISHILVYNTWMFIKKKGNLKKVIDNMASVYPICLAFTVLEF